MMDFIQTILVLHLYSACIAMKPPIWPSRYSVHFLEEGHLPGESPFYQNNGSWYYDFDNNVALFDKGQGQHDFECSEQAKFLSPIQPHAPCQLLFAHDTNMYVIYPNTKTCCTPCGEKQYCGLIKPNWLANSTYFGNQTFEGKTCYGWEITGSTTKDYWYVTDKNVPCQYHQIPPGKGGAITSLTFHQESYKLSVPDSSFFAIPDYCTSKCPQ